MTARLAWRSLWRHRRRTIITVASIGLGLMLAIFFISIAEGVYGQLTDDAVREYAGHVTLEHPGYRDAPAIDLFIEVPAELRARIEALPEVAGTKALILGQGVARSSAGAAGVAIMGVEPDAERAASPLARNLVAGEYLAAGDDAWVVIGSQLASQLKVEPGRKFVVVANDAQGELVEELVRVRGVFSTGADEIDAYLIQMPVAFARRLYHLPEGSLSQLGILLHRPGAIDRVAGAVRALAGERSIAVLPWQKVLPELASYIRVDRFSNKIFQGLLLVVILFTIFNTILMSVLERQREFAVLLALGTRSRQIRWQVFVESVFIGALGCLAGMVLGGLTAYATQVYGLDLSRFASQGYNVSGFAMSAKVHARLSAGILFGTTGLVFAATVLLSLLPMRRSTQVSIADVLR